MSKIKYPVTVRQAQRAVAAKNYGLRAELGKELLGREHRLAGEIERVLDRLAAQYGPNHVILASPESPAQETAVTSGVSRPKGTDEVAPQSDNPSEDSQMHGGDGASGEVENGLSQGGDNMSGVGGAASDQGQEATGTGSGGTGEKNTEGTPSPQSLPSDAANAEHPASETGNTSEGEVTSAAGEQNGGSADGKPGSVSGTGMVALQDDRDAQAIAMYGKALAPPTPGAESQTGTANEQSDEWSTAPPSNPGDTDTVSENVQYRYRKPGGTGRASTQAKHAAGGVTAEMKKAGVTSQLVRQARSALSRLVDGENQSGPRYDWTEFSKRLVTGRPVYPARKEEDGRPAVLILADVSGSCSAFSDVALMVAKAAAKSGVNGADVVIVAHSNGYPQEWQVNDGKPQKIDLPWGEKAQAWYDNNLRKYQIKAVVALGDWDAEWLYHWLAEMPAVTRLVWLDNWSSSVMPPTVRRDLFKKASANTNICFDAPWHFEQPWSKRAAGKSTYVVGCGTGQDFLDGLKLAL